MQHVILGWQEKLWRRKRISLLENVGRKQWIIQQALQVGMSKTAHHCACSLEGFTSLYIICPLVPELDLGWQSRLCSALIKHCGLGSQSKVIPKRTRGTPGGRLLWIHCKHTTMSWYVLISELWLRLLLQCWSDLPTKCHAQWTVPKTCLVISSITGTSRQMPRRVILNFQQASSHLRSNVPMLFDVQSFPQNVWSSLCNTPRCTARSVAQKNLVKPPKHGSAGPTHFPDWRANAPSNDQPIYGTMSLSTFLFQHYKIATHDITLYGTHHRCTLTYNQLFMEHLQSVQNESLEANQWRVVLPRLDFPLKSRFVLLVVMVLKGHVQNLHETTATFCADQCSLPYCRCAQGCPSVLPVQLQGLKTSLSKTIKTKDWYPMAKLVTQTFKDIQRISKDSVSACMSNQLAGPLGEQSHVPDLQPTNVHIKTNAEERCGRIGINLRYRNSECLSISLNLQASSFGGKSLVANRSAMMKTKKWECGNGEVGAVLLSVLFRLSTFLASVCCNSDEKIIFCWVLSRR